MQIVMAGENTCGLCHDTPNAIASARKHSAANRAVDVFGEVVTADPARLAAGGWVPVAQSGRSPAGPEHLGLGRLFNEITGGGDGMAAD